MTSVLIDSLTVKWPLSVPSYLGETESILRWYENIFQMKSFDFGEGGDGIQIQVDDIGMQLKVCWLWSYDGYLKNELGLWVRIVCVQIFDSFIYPSINFSFIYSFVHSSSIHPSFIGSLFHFLIQLSVCPSIFLSFHRMIHLFSHFPVLPRTYSIHPFFHLAIILLIHPTIHPIFHSSVHLFSFLSCHPFVHPFFHPSVYLFIYPSVHSFIHQSFHSLFHLSFCPFIPIILLSIHSIHPSIHPFHPSFFTAGIGILEMFRERIIRSFSVEEEISVTRRSRTLTR